MKCCKHWQYRASTLCLLNIPEDPNPVFSSGTKVWPGSNDNLIPFRLNNFLSCIRADIRNLTTQPIQFFFHFGTNRNIFQNSDLRRLWFVNQKYEYCTQNTYLIALQVWISIRFIWILYISTRSSSKASMAIVLVIPHNPIIKFWPIHWCIVLFCK